MTSSVVARVSSLRALSFSSYSTLSVMSFMTPNSTLCSRSRTIESSMYFLVRRTNTRFLDTFFSLVAAAMNSSQSKQSKASRPLTSCSVMPSSFIALALMSRMRKSSASRTMPLGVFWMISLLMDSARERI